MVKLQFVSTEPVDFESANFDCKINSVSLPTLKYYLFLDKCRESSQTFMFHTPTSEYVIVSCNFLSCISLKNLTLTGEVYNIDHIDKY